MVAGLFTKDVEPGSAMRAAGALHGSAHVHAIRYGEKGSKTYRRAYSQHVGRFLSCLREVSKAGPADEARDNAGRWSGAGQSLRSKLYGTTGVVGLSRAQVVSKVKGLLDGALSHEEGLSRKVTYPAGLAGIATRVAQMVLPGNAIPEDVAASTQKHVAHATGYVIHKVQAHPRFQRLAVKAMTHLRKGLDQPEGEELKDLVATTIADTSFHPRVACDDGALAAVAHGAFRHCHDRLCALKQAASN